MSLRRYTRLLRIAMVWIVVMSLAVDTASACWWLKCRRSRHLCQPVCSQGASAAGYGDVAGDTPTEATPPQPTDDPGWRPPTESETAGYDDGGEDPGDSTVPAELIVPAGQEPAVVPQGDPLNELFVEGEDAAGDLDAPATEEEEEVFGSGEAEEEFLDEEMEEELAGENEEDLLGGDEEEVVDEDENLFGTDEEEASEEGDLFGEGDGEIVEDEELFGEEGDLDPPANEGDQFGAEVEDPAAEPGAGDEDEDLFGPAEEEEDLFGPAEEEEDLFGPAEEETEELMEEEGDLFGPAAEEEDLFGPSEEEALFGPAEDAGEAVEDDLFGPTEDATEDAADDLFGPAAEEEDLFGPAEDSADAVEDDLFGPTEEATEDATDDLFGPIEQDPAVEENELEENSFDPFGGAPVPAEALGMRTWVDNTGLYSTTGRLLVIDEDSVQLLKENGATTTVPLRRLSDADRVLVEQVIAVYGLGEIDLVASR